MKLTKKQKYIFLKCSEELNELSTVLIQQINKPDKELYNSIVLEIEDVNKRMKFLKELLLPEKNYPNYNPKSLKFGDLK